MQFEIVSCEICNLKTDLDRQSIIALENVVKDFIF